MANVGLCEGSDVSGTRTANLRLGSGEQLAECDVMTVLRIGLAERRITVGKTKQETIVERASLVGAQYLNVAGPDHTRVVEPKHRDEEGPKQSHPHESDRSGCPSRRPAADRSQRQDRKPGDSEQRRPEDSLVAVWVSD